MLQGHGRTLCALADRWETVAPAVRDVLSPFEGAEDLNDPAALQLDGVLFMEGEGEPAEITRVKRDLRAVGDEAAATGAWLTSAMSASWEMAASLVDVDELAGLLGDRHRIIANDWQAAEMSALAGRILHRAADMIEDVDFAPAALRRDLESARVAPRLLHSASELISHAADLLSDSAGLVHDNEPRWRRFRARVQASRVRPGRHRHHAGRRSRPGNREPRSDVERTPFPGSRRSEATPRVAPAARPARIGRVPPSPRPLPSRSGRAAGPHVPGLHARGS